MLFKKCIYIENTLKNKKETTIILDKIKPENIIYINHYKDILNQSGGNWRFQKNIQKIVLAERKDNFYYKGSYLTPNFGYDYFYYNTLAINCLYDCSYCYLQGMYNTPNLVLFLNNYDFINETKKLLQNNPNQQFYFAISYDTDLLALEYLYPYCSEWINFAKEHHNLTIEIRTKSSICAITRQFKNINNVIFSWSILPEFLVKKFEPATPPLENRLTAINTYLDSGFKVMLCIDPLILIPNYEKIYSEFIHHINQKIDLQNIFKISIGTFRMNKDYFKKTQIQYSNNPVYLYPYNKFGNAIGYPPTIAENLINSIVKPLEKLYNNPIEIYA